MRNDPLWVLGPASFQKRLTACLHALQNYNDSNPLDALGITTSGLLFAWTADGDKKILWPYVAASQRQQLLQKITSRCNHGTDKTRIRFVLNNQSMPWFQIIQPADCSCWILYRSGSERFPHLLT